MDFGRLGMIVDPATGRRRAVWGLIIVLATRGTASSGRPMGRRWRTSSPDWKRRGSASAGCPSIWSSTIARQRWRDQTRCIRASPEASWNTRSTGVSSPMRRGCGNPRTSPRWTWRQYVRERFFKGGDFHGLPHLRAEAQRWCLEVAGMRVHGTTRRKPLVVFQDEERHTLLPWDGEPYEIADWRMPRSIPTITSSVSRPCIRCHRTGARRVSRWKSGWAASGDLTGAS